MTPQALVAKLESIIDEYKLNNSALLTKVVVDCPVAFKHYWIHSDSIKVEVHEGTVVIVIEGGFGA
jgi:hypothetical protein